MYCTNCGTDNTDDNKFCINCGQVLGTERAETVPDIVTDSEPSTSSPASSPTPSASSQGSRRWLVIIAAIILLVAAIAAVLMFTGVLGGGGGPELLVAFPNRDDEADLKVLRLGQDEADGQEVAENALAADDYDQANLWYRDENGFAHRIGSSYGGFLPDSDRLVIYYLDDDEIVVKEAGIGDEQAVEIISTDALPVSMSYLPDSKKIFLSETRSDLSRCYVAEPGQEADRITKGDNCYISQDAATVLVDERDDGELSLSSMNLEGANETTIFDNVEGVEDYHLSSDTSHVAYHLTTDDGAQVILADRSSGEPVMESAEFAEMKTYAFLENSDAFVYVVENEDGDIEILTSDNSTPIATELSVGIAYNPDERYLVYIVSDEDGEKTVYSYDREDGANSEILVGDNLRFSLLPNQDRILILEDSEDEVAIYSTPLGGSETVDVYQDDDMNLASSAFLDHTSLLYLISQDEDGANYLYVTPVDRDEGYYLLDDWYNLSLLNISSDGCYLVFEGREDSGDDPVLYSIEVADGARPVELDDSNDDYPNAVFSQDDRNIIFSAIDGSRPDDVSVHQLPVDGEERATKLYDEAYIVDTRWSELEPFRDWNNIVYWIGDIYKSTSPCPGARNAALGETISGQIESGSEECIRFRVSGGEQYTIDLDSPESQSYDFRLRILNREGDEMAYNDDGPSGNDPRLRFTPPETGTYYLKVFGNGSADNPVFQLGVHEGLGEEALDNAQRLNFNELVSDAITESDDFHLEIWDSAGYADFYYFVGEAGDEVEVSVRAPSIGSTLEPAVVLLDAIAEDFLAVASEDNSSGGDYGLAYTIPTDGRYYIVVGPSGDDYGSANDYFYELTLTR